MVVCDKYIFLFLFLLHGPKFRLSFVFLTKKIKSIRIKEIILLIFRSLAPVKLEINHCFEGV